MNDALQYKNVAVAVIYDAPSDSFLLWNNKRWQGYAFPMKQMDPAADPQCAALAALDDRDMTLELSRATASPIDRLIETLFSEGTRRVTVYDYHVYAVDLVPGGGLRGDPTLHPDFRYFTYDELLSATNVTKSTADIARELVEDRKVAVAVVHRTGTSGTGTSGTGPSGSSARGTEFLLVSNSDGKYFFPSTRMKTELLPAEAASRAVALDLGYERRLEVPKQSEVPALQSSRRFGTRQVRFYFYPCLVTLPGIDLTAPGNALEQAVNALQPQPYWGWFTEAELRTLPQMSPSVAIVLNTVLQLVG